MRKFDSKVSNFFRDQGEDNLSLRLDIEIGYLVCLFFLSLSTLILQACLFILVYIFLYIKDILSLNTLYTY